MITILIMPDNNSSSDARQRILDKAEELFYSNGFRATGINQIIQESGVAKATFYSHFESKDALCLAYLKRMSEREELGLEQEIAKRKTPLSKYMALIEMIEPWLRQTNFRGCAFLNMVPEAPDFQSPMRLVGALYYKRCAAIIERQVRELIASDPELYRDLDPRQVASQYITIFSGAIALCELLHDIKPIRGAVEMIRALVPQVKRERKEM